jgi:hypothetical protein
MERQQNNGGLNYAYQLHKMKVRYDKKPFRTRQKIIHIHLTALLT